MNHSINPKQNMHKENQTKAEIKKTHLKEGCDCNNCRLARSSNGTASSNEWEKTVHLEFYIQ